MRYCGFVFIVFSVLQFTAIYGCASGDDEISGSDVNAFGDRYVEIEVNDTLISDAADIAINDATDDAIEEERLDAPPEQTEAITSVDKITTVPESAQWKLPGMTAPAYVLFTEGHVPHVYAENRNDLGRALGFLLARDRFFVADLARRLGLGTLSELLGDIVLSSDLESRSTGITAVADRLCSHIALDDAAYLDALADGFNFYIAEVAAGRLPPPSELNLAAGLLGVPSPAALMTPFDRRSLCGLMAVVMYETTFETGDVGNAADLAELPTLYADFPEELQRINGLIPDLWSHQEAMFSDASSAGFGLETHSGNAMISQSHQIPAASLPVPSSMIRRTAERLDALEKRLGRDKIEGFGSNAWAVSKNGTADGSAIACGDGHLQLSVPALMYQIGLDTRELGAGDIHQLGLMIANVPALAVGTNGNVAYSQVNPVLDITDWYREEVKLDDNGVPTHTRFQEEWRQLNAIEESYVIADVAALSSVGRTEKITRYTTFDGRPLFSVEGEPWDGKPLPQGKGIVNVSGDAVVPGDIDSDGQVTAISFDYVALDATAYFHTIDSLALASDVASFREATKGLVGSGLFSAVADQNGDILYSSYQAVPCRTYLPRQANGSFEPGADPTLLIDGTKFSGFSLPTHPDGKIDEAPGQRDPYQCAVPFDEMPQSLSPSSGYVVTANNQPAPLTTDGNLFNDKWYIGGPWSSARAHAISREVKLRVDGGYASIDEMAKIQGDRQSAMGGLFVPFLVQAISDAESSPETASLWARQGDKFSQVRERLQAWQSAGFQAAAGVDTFYHSTSAQDREDAVATMIFNAWMPRIVKAVFGDEGIGVAFRFDGTKTQLIALRRLLQGRGPGNPMALFSYDDQTMESAYFDILGTPDRETSTQVIVQALDDTLNWLSSPGTGPGEGGFGTENMENWLWGLRHQARFESLLAGYLENVPQFSFLADQFSITTVTLPLAANMSASDPRAALKWFPRPGDNYGIDAANPGWSGNRFTHGSGPVMRMVIALKNGSVSGQNILPGGQSGLTDSPFFADQAKLWLANKAYPLRFHLLDVIGGATERETFLPEGM